MVLLNWPPSTSALGWSVNDQVSGFQVLYGFVLVIIPVALYCFGHAIHLFKKYKVDHIYMRDKQNK